MFQDKKMQVMKKYIQDRKNCCLGRIFGAAADKQTVADIEENLANEGEVLQGCIGRIYLFPYQPNGNHATELATVGHVISEQHWKSNFNFNMVFHQILTAS